ncbi:hypothetical protein [Peribacillus loiseleuriae]|uniref:hypothetical protein n=1 Tax=Peribacillus loiseleuriae TaxID=1679170 RepID=UPI003D03BA9A
MFQVHEDDLQYLLESAGQPVLINDTPMNVIVTNPSISEYEERYIHSLDKVSRGDIVTLEDEQYLCLSESIIKRHGKYKVLARHMNVTIEIPGEETRIVIGHTPFGDPIFDYRYGEPSYIKAIVDNKSFSVDESASIRLPNNQTEVIVKDNELNRGKFRVNNQVNAIAKRWKVINQDLSKNGLLILTCELG